jgi:HNH endonuclease
MAKPNRAEVEAVIDEYKRIGPKAFAGLYHYRESTRYDLLYEGERFPPKAIYNVAFKRARGEDDKTGNAAGLGGGEAVNQPLRQLDFEIVEKSDLESGLDVPDAAADYYAERSIAHRRGQAKFRGLLFAAYEECCAVTGCNVAEILEACHIKPYSNFRDYAVSNGILLRADVHTLFDLGLIKIGPEDMRLYVADSIKDQEYRQLHGRAVRQPKDKNKQIHREFLMNRWERPSG